MTGFAAQTDAVLGIRLPWSDHSDQPRAPVAGFGFDPTGMPVSGFLEKPQLAGGLDSGVAWRVLRGETILAAEHTAGERVFETSVAPMRDEEDRIWVGHNLARYHRTEAGRGRLA